MIKLRTPPIHRFPIKLRPSRWALYRCTIKVGAVISQETSILSRRKRCAKRKFLENIIPLFFDKIEEDPVSVDV